jgi:hypothetical protein
MMQTKWSIMVREASDALREANEAAARAEQAYLSLVGLENTPCGLRCSGCDTFLATEADFAKHFRIPDRRYKNLGECPNK